MAKANGKRWYLVCTDMVDIHTIDIESKLGRSVSHDDAIGYAWYAWEHMNKSEQSNTACFYVAYMKAGKNGKPMLDTAHATYFNRGYEMKEEDA